MSGAAGNAENGAAPAPDEVADLVRSLATVMHQSGVTELDLNLGSVAVRMRRPEGFADYPTEHHAASQSEIDAVSPEPGHLVTSPMVGTFYASPTPGAPPFVREGDEVVAGQTIGIIEAMKIMNEVAVDRSGVILDILTSNGQPVEYGSLLMRLGRQGDRP